MKNCYWLDTLTMPSVPEGVLVNSMSREESEMKTLDLVELLNNGRGDSGSKWGQSSDGFPYFGENQSYKPDTEAWPELPGESKYQVEFTSFDGSEKETLTDSRIQVSPDQVNSYQIAGTFSLKDYQAPEGSSLEWNCTEMKPAGCMAMSLSDGELLQMYRAVRNRDTKVCGKNRRKSFLSDWSEKPETSGESAFYRRECFFEMQRTGIRQNSSKCGNCGKMGVSWMQYVENSRIFRRSGGSWRMDHQQRNKDFM